MSFLLGYSFILSLVTMITTRKRLCLVYLAPTLCLIGIIYTVFYTEYKLPQMIKRIQNNLALNKEIYIQNLTNDETRHFSAFASYDSHEKQNEDNSKTSSSDSEATYLLEECQIWIPVRDKSLFSEVRLSSDITDKLFLSVCSIESAIKSYRSDEESKTRICLLVDRFYNSLSMLSSSERNQSKSSVVFGQDKYSLQSIKTQNWFRELKKKYDNHGNNLNLITPDYSTVFSGKKRNVPIIKYGRHSI